MCKLSFTPSRVACRALLLVTTMTGWMAGDSYARAASDSPGITQLLELQ